MFFETEKDKVNLCSENRTDYRSKVAGRPMTARGWPDWSGVGGHQGGLAGVPQAANQRGRVAQGLIAIDDATWFENSTREGNSYIELAGGDQRIEAESDSMIDKVSTCLGDARVGTVPSGLAQLQQDGRVVGDAGDVLHGREQALALNHTEFRMSQIRLKEPCLVWIDQVPEGVEVDGLEPFGQFRFVSKIGSKASYP